jgi:type III restriction enzyme
MAFLHEIFNNPFARKALAKVVLPNGITDNLKFGIRPYQEEAFRRYLYTEREDFDGKPKKPLHLLYNMATGSGKTMVMGGLMLHLYEKGYRDFCFLSTVIISFRKRRIIFSILRLQIFI